MILDVAKSVRLEHEVARRGGLGLKRFGSELVGACPRCGGIDRFGVSISKQVFLCRGCGAAGDIIAFVQHVDGVDFRTAVSVLDGFEIVPRNSQNAKIEGQNKPIALVNQTDIDQQNIERALKLWNDATPIDGTPAERYLHGRGLDDLPGDRVLRFHASCPFGKTRVACLLALYTDIATNEPKAIGRTAINLSGNKIGRMSLGPVENAAVKIHADENVEQGLVIGEGLETCLAARQLGFRPVWSLGSANAIRDFNVLAGITSLTILIDNDPPDRNGRLAGPDAALECSERWRDAGVEVTRITPRRQGDDMADLIIERGTCHGAG
jgi:hypothetical protein